LKRYLFYYVFERPERFLLVFFKIYLAKTQRRKVSNSLLASLGLGEIKN